MHMISFGMMSLNLKSELSYFTEIARRANADKFNCYRFTPSQIHPLSQLATGERFDPKQDKWVREEFPVPKILYDRCFYSDDLISKNSMAIVKWLKSRDDLTFIGNGLPNKWSIYEVLSTSQLSPYIPETVKVTCGKMIIAQLHSWGKLLLKPVFGSGGTGIYSVEKKGQTFIISNDLGGELTQKTIHSESETEEWLDQLFDKKDYLFQPYLELTDSQNRPFDIRVLLQKDMTGRWTVRGKGIRRGKENGILSNLRAGGEIFPLEEYVSSLSQRSRIFVLHELDEILTKLPAILESSFPRLFELGIDIAISKDNALWILDTNSKPGRKVLFDTNPEVKDILYRAPIEYALFLAKNPSKREEQHS